MFDPDEEKKIDELSEKISFWITIGITFLVFISVFFIIQYFLTKWFYPSFLSIKVWSTPLFIPLFISNGALIVHIGLYRNDVYKKLQQKDKNDSE